MKTPCKTLVSMHRERERERERERDRDERDRENKQESTQRKKEREREGGERRGDKGENGTSVLDAVVRAHERGKERKTEERKKAHIKKRRRET
jgi:hypothetical protein